MRDAEREEARREIELTKRKFGTEWPSMDAICNACRDTYGRHIGATCPRDLGTR